MEDRTKWTQEELAILFWLLNYCNGDLTECGSFKEALPAAASDMDTLSNNCKKLDHREFNSLISKSLNRLGNKKLGLATKSDLMGLLVMLCSRSDYAKHFHHKKDVNYDLIELQDILSLENDGNKPVG